MHRPPIQNLRIATMLAWEFWASNWQGLLLAPLGALAFPSLILLVLRLEGAASLRGVAGAMQFGCYWASVVFLGAPVLVALGDPRRRYTLPASGVILVATPMVCCMLTVFAQYAFVATALNAVFDAGWSVCGPGLLAAMFLAWLQAMLWSTWNSPGLQVGACMASFGALMLVIALGAPPGSPAMARFLSGVDRWQLLAFVMAAVSSLGVGAGGFARLRHGTEVDVKCWLDRLGGPVSTRQRARQARFSSPQAAQFWREWTERGQTLPLGVGGIGVGAIVLACFATAIASDSFKGVGFLFQAQLAFSGLFLTTCLVWGVRSRQSDLGAFLGSRPLSDVQLAKIILQSATLAFVLSLVIWAASMALLVVILRERPEMLRAYSKLQQFGVPGVLAGGAFAAILVWSAMNLYASIFLSGARWTPVLIGLPFGAALIGAVLPFCFHPQARHDAAQVYWSFWIAIGLLGCVTTFIASWRRRLIDQRTLGLSAVLVLTSGALALATAHFAAPPLAGKYWVMALACCGLAPIPLAAAPLAIYWNRHR